MKTMSKETSRRGLGFMDILQLIFIVLKLTNLISWSWWWVLAPTWGSIILVVVLMLIYLVCDD